MNECNNGPTTAGNTTYQDNFPEEQQNLLDRKVRSITAAELGDHCKQHHGETILSRHWQHWTKDKKNIILQSHICQP